MLKYYLDTATIYELKNIPDSILQQSFYSVFSLIEIIAEVDQNTFSRRRYALKNILNSVAKCDDTFPEALVFSSFDYFSDYDFIEQRKEDLFTIFLEIIKSDSFEEFNGLHSIRQKEYDLGYFAALDKRYTDSFLGASLKGKSLIDDALRQSPCSNVVVIGDKEYKMRSRRDIVNFLDEPLINSSFTIVSLANAAINFAGLALTDEIEEVVYESYNNSLKIFVDGFSAYSLRQTIDDSNPMRNDFQDLTHLLYLRNNAALQIVSNDRLFERCVPNHTITVNALLSIQQ